MFFRFIVAAALAALIAALGGCATGPERHVKACAAIAVDAVSGIECIQQKLRADPSTPEGFQLRIDFMAIAAQRLSARVGAGEITREQARLAYEALVRELDTPSRLSFTTAYVSQSTLDVIGLSTDSPAFNRYVKPAFSSSLVTGASPGSGVPGASDDSPCVESTCGPVSVKGYYRKDGTYVRPHTRSAPGSGRGRR